MGRLEKVDNKVVPSLAGNLINYLLAGNQRPTTCTKVGNAGLEALAKGLPAQMTFLTLNVGETKKGNFGW